jgi:hypothetical protein
MVRAIACMPRTGRRALVANTQRRGRFALRARRGRFRERALGAAPSLSASFSVELFAVAASFRRAVAGFADLGFAEPSTGTFATRLPFNAWTPSTTAATVVNFERIDIT